jgi:hypothetical protein
MSQVRPGVISRVSRLVSDIAVNISGQRAVLYRYLGDEELQNLPDTESIYEDVDLADKGESDSPIFDGPFNTELAVNWPDERIITNEDELDLSRRSEEIDPFEATPKFEDFVTRKSYFKVLYRAVSHKQANFSGDPYGESGEAQIVVRLEVVDSSSFGQHTEGGNTVKLSLKTDNDRLAEFDNNLDDDAQYLFNSP